MRILPQRKTFPSSNCPREELKRKVCTSQQDMLQCVTAISVCRTLSPFLHFCSSLFIIFPLAMKLRGISTLSLQLRKKRCWRRIRLVCGRRNSPTWRFALGNPCCDISVLLYCKVYHSTPRKPPSWPANLLVLCI